MNRAPHAGPPAGSLACKVIAAELPGSGTPSPLRGSRGTPRGRATGAPLRRSCCAASAAAPNASITSAAASSGERHHTRALAPRRSGGHPRRRAAALLRAASISSRSSSGTSTPGRFISSSVSVIADPLHASSYQRQAAVHALAHHRLRTFELAGQLAVWALVDHAPPDSHALLGRQGREPLLGLVLGDEAGEVSSIEAASRSSSVRTIHPLAGTSTRFDPTAEQGFPRARVGLYRAARPRASPRPRVESLDGIPGHARTSRPSGRAPDHHGLSPAQRSRARPAHDADRRARSPRGHPTGLATGPHRCGLDPGHNHLLMYCTAAGRL